MYDGDTCAVDIDLGLNTWIRGEKVRLHRINAPELTGRSRARGLAARDHLRQLILNQPVIIQTIKDRREKYGRYLAEIWIEQQGRWINANDAMISAGHARLARYEPAHRHQTDFVSGRNTPRRVGVSRQGDACATPTGEYRVFLAELTSKEITSWQAGAGASATAGRNRARSSRTVP